MRWGLAVVAVLGLAACGPREDCERSSATVGRAAALRAGTADDSTRLLRRARAAVPAASDVLDAALREWPPPDAREPEDPPPPPESPVFLGRVVDPTGAPIERAHVVCFLGVESCDGRTGPDGRYAIPSPERTGVVRCIAWADGWAVHVGPWRATEGDADCDLGTTVLAPAARIAGRVVDEFGETVEGDARLRIDTSEVFDAETRALLERETDLFGDGSTSSHAWMDFEVTSLPPGRYRLTATFRDFQNRAAEPVAVVAPAEDVVIVSRPVPPPPPEFDADVEVVAADAGEWVRHPVEFSLAGGPESPVPAMRVLSIWRGPYDQPARFRVRFSVEEFPVRLVATAGDGATGEVELQRRSEEPVRLEVRRTEPRDRVLEGRVTHRGDPLRWDEAEVGSCGSPGGTSTVLVGHRVRVTADRADGRGVQSSTLSAPDGTWRLDELEDAEYEVTARVSDSDTSPKLAPATARCRPGTPVVLDLPPAGRRPFRVVLPGGAEAEEDFDAWVFAMDGIEDASNWEWQGRTPVATDLRPGVAYRLDVRARVGRTWTAWAHVNGFTAGDDFLDVRLDPGLRIEGTVVREDGSPVIGAYVYAEAVPDDFGDSTDVYAGLDGRFVLTGVDARTWRIEASAPGLSNESAPLEVVGGGTGVVVVVGRPSERP